MYEEFLEKYCNKHRIDEKTALTHAIVKEFMTEKERVDKEEQVSIEKMRIQRNKV